MLNFKMSKFIKKKNFIIIGAIIIIASIIGVASFAVHKNIEKKNSLEKEKEIEERMKDVYSRVTIDNDEESVKFKTIKDAVNYSKESNSITEKDYDNVSKFAKDFINDSMKNDVAAVLKYIYPAVRYFVVKDDIRLVKDETNTFNMYVTDVSLKPNGQSKEYGSENTKGFTANYKLYLKSKKTAVTYVYDCEDNYYIAKRSNIFYICDFTHSVKTKSSFLRGEIK